MKLMRLIGGVEMSSVKAPEWVKDSAYLRRVLPRFPVWDSSFRIWLDFHLAGLTKVKAMAEVIALK